jgi:glucokinase
MRRRVVIAVDVGGTTIAAGLVSAEGEVLEHETEPTHGRGPGTALDTLHVLVDRTLEAARGRTLDVDGVGIGVPGTVDVETGTIAPGVHYVPELGGQPLAALVAARAGLPVYVDNDVNALALGEWMFGAGRGARSLVLLAIGTGVGGGVILDGRIMRGAGGFGGELGHVPIDFDGRPCICGGRGCLKAYVSGTDIAEEGSRRLGRRVSASEIFRLAQAGDAIATGLVGEVCAALGAGLAIIVNGLNPERLLIGGGVAESLEPLAEDIRTHARRHAYRGALETTEIVIVPTDKRAALRGGAALVRYETPRRKGETP